MNMAELKLAHPGHSEEWYDAWFLRAMHYVMHHGDMTSAPELPDEAA